jgi:transposase
MPAGNILQAALEVSLLGRSARRLRDIVTTAVINSGRAATETAAAHGVSWWLVQRALGLANTRLPSVENLRLRVPGNGERRSRSVRFFKTLPPKFGKASDHG